MKVTTGSDKIMLEIEIAYTVPQSICHRRGEKEYFFKTLVQLASTKIFVIVPANRIHTQCRIYSANKVLNPEINLRFSLAWLCVMVSTYRLFTARQKITIFLIIVCRANMKIILYFLFLVSFCSDSFSQFNCDILIRHGKIIDGTGNNWFYGDVAVRGSRIVFIGRNAPFKAEKVIDAKGMIVSPGFIDVHTHIEGDEIDNPYANNFIADGVTTVITGNCGLSNTDIGKYFSFLDSLHLSINVATLIGHNDVRRAVMGEVNRAPTSDELERMKGIVGRAMKDGAVGMSTGLIYIPGTYSKTDEIVSLAKVVAAYNGVYTTHMRDEGDSVVEAIDEALAICKEANLPVEISHFKLSGQQNWGRSIQTLGIVKEAREHGMDVTIDQYPYTASSSSLNILLPDWVLADGRDSVVARLSRKEVRKQVEAYMTKKLKNRKLSHLGYAMVANYKTDTTLNGKSIEAINLIWKRKHDAVHEFQTVMDMVSKGGASMIYHGMSELDVQNIMKYPFNMFASDAGIRVFNEGVPHPRGYGTNARVLGKYVRREKIISLEEAIRRMTSLPAQKFQLKSRGLLKEGYAADIVIFDPAKVKDMSVYERPHQYSVGFAYVLVNGKVTFDHEVHTGERNGEVLYGPGKDTQQ